MGGETFHPEPRSFLSILFLVYTRRERTGERAVGWDNRGVDRCGRERPRDTRTHTTRVDGGCDASRRAERCDRAIEWKTEMLMRWSGSAGERASESASDLPRKLEGGDKRRG